MVLPLGLKSGVWTLGANSGTPGALLVTRIGLLNSNAPHPTSGSSRESAPSRQLLSSLGQCRCVRPCDFLANPRVRGRWSAVQLFLWPIRSFLNSTASMRIRLSSGWEWGGGRSMDGPIRLHQSTDRRRAVLRPQRQLRNQKNPILR